MDRFIAEIAEAEKPDDAVREAMVRKAELFLRAGGAVSWDFWATLSAESQMAFAEAGDRIAACRAAQQGTANLGKAGIAAVLAPADGGDAVVRMALEGAVANVTREMQGEPA